MPLPELVELPVPELPVELPELFNVPASVPELVVPEPVPVSVPTPGADVGSVDIGSDVPAPGPLLPDAPVFFFFDFLADFVDFESEDVPDVVPIESLPTDVPEVVPDVMPEVAPERLPE